MSEPKDTFYKYKQMNRLKIVTLFMIFLLFFIITGCDDKRDEFISLDKLTFTNDYYKDTVKISYYILINNPNSVKDALKNDIVNYVKSRLKHEKILMQKNVTSIDFVFYKKTNNTSYFMKNKEDTGGFSSEEISHYKEDYIANYYVQKCIIGTIEKIYFYDLPEEVIVNNCKE